MKVTDKQIAEEFGVTNKTIHNWKNGSEEKRKLYNALRNSILEQDTIIWEVYFKDKKEIINNSVIGYYIATNKDITEIRRLKI